MKYKIYYSSQRNDLGRVEELIKDREEGYEVFDLATADLTEEDVQKILDVMGMWAVDLVDASHTLWTDSHLNEESDDQEIVQYIASEPEIIKTPFVIKDGAGGVMCDLPESVFSLFS